MDRCVFFADLLGFGDLSCREGGQPALDALSDVGLLLSKEDAVARHLQPDVWLSRYGLSDSLFLVAADTSAAVAAACELFFNLAYASCRARDVVLLRGGIARGAAHDVPPLFPETGSGNLVGAGVVEAARLERRPEKGPRLFLSRRVAEELTACRAPIAWAMRCLDTGAELLWLLPPDVSNVNPCMIGDVCRKAVQLYELNCGAPQISAHYVGYMSLALESLARLRDHNPEQAAAAVARGEIHRLRGSKLPNLDVLLD